MKLQRWAQDSQPHRGSGYMARHQAGAWARYSDLAPLLAALEKADGALEECLLLLPFSRADDGDLEKRVEADALTRPHAERVLRARAALAAIKEVRGA